MIACLKPSLLLAAAAPHVEVLSCSCTPLFPFFVFCCFCSFRKRGLLSLRIKRVLELRLLGLDKHLHFLQLRTLMYQITSLASKSRNRYTVHECAELHKSAPRNASCAIVICRCGGESSFGFWFPLCGAAHIIGHTAPQLKPYL